MEEGGQTTMAVAKGARVAVLIGPPGAAKTGALVTLTAMLTTITGAKILATVHGNNSFAAAEAAFASAMAPCSSAVMTCS